MMTLYIYMGKKDTKQSCNHHFFRGTSVALFILVDAGSGYTHKTHAQQTTTTTPTSSFFFTTQNFLLLFPHFFIFHMFLTSFLPIAL